MSDIQSRLDRASILHRLRHDGVSMLDQSISTRTMALVRKHLKTRPVYAAHIKKDAPDPLAYDALASSAPVACHDMADVMNVTCLLKFALGYADLAAQFLGVDTPYLYSANAFWTFPRGDLRGDIQAFHRDSDDERFMALFVFGTAVTEAKDGAHLYQKMTQDGAENGEMETITGGSGSAFVVNPRGLHMGLKPAYRPRLLFWFRYGISNPPPSYVWDKLAPCELEDRSILQDRRTREILHLVAK